MNELQAWSVLPVRGRFLTPVVGFVLIFVALQSLFAQQKWTPIGPDGGDARAFASVPDQPNHLYLGTLNSWIYESTDQGASWHRLAKLDVEDDLVLDSILVDESAPATIFVGAWKLGQSGGGLWMSRDAGKHFTTVEGLRGQSIRSFVQAPSNPKMLFAGTLEGVYRSTDGGTSWTLISPPGSREIHEVESLAVDPANPDIVYAGTWHLPWKTSDGGKNWENIKKGLIDDSDVFSIIIDPKNVQTVFLSACSGIYKSENAGALFHKIAGIPSTARRTRVLMQDPRNGQIVYAGTTEGLYKTIDGGKTFKAMTGSDVIINDVFVDPDDTNHVLLATDRGGVLTSKDAGVSFTASNIGISERKVDALLIDHANPSRQLAGVLNDKTFGGVFVSKDNGTTWEQMSQGLEGRDVFSLQQAPDGTIVAGTSHGIFALEDEPSPHWKAINTIANTVEKPVTEKHGSKSIHVEKKVKEPVVELASRAAAIDVSGDVWLASTGIGLLTSKDKGETWQGGPVGGAGDYLSVAAHDKNLVAARSDGAVVSTDGGSTWAPMQVPISITRIHCIAFTPDGTLWLGAREGVFFTKDLGKGWMWIERLPFRDVDQLSYDAAQGAILATSQASDWIYAIDPKLLNWKWWRTGYPISLARSSGSHMIAASLFNGVVMEPRPAGAHTAQK